MLSADPSPTQLLQQFISKAISQEKLLSQKQLDVIVIEELNAEGMQEKLQVFDLI